MSKTKALDLDSWKLRFKHQDKPSHFWQGVVVNGYVVLIEHTPHGETRAREITLDGRVPRRSTAIPGRVLCARSWANQVMVLLDEGRLYAFDPITFEFRVLAHADVLANELTVSTSQRWCYAGSVGGMSPCTTAVNLQNGRSWDLPFDHPTAVLPIPSTPDATEEWWLHPREQLRRRVHLSNEKGPEVREVLDEPRFRGVERIWLVPDETSEPVVYTLGCDTLRRTHDLLDMRPAERELSRLRLGPAGWQVEATHAASAISEIIGLCSTTSGSRLVVLERTSEVMYGQGPVYVRLLDALSLKVVASRFLAKSGPYELPLLVAPAALLLFSRKLGVGINRAYCVRWGASTPALQIAQVTIT